MSKLPHRVLAGSTYFITSSTSERRELFRVQEIAEILVRRILVCRDKGAYQLHEFVVMPNHFHFLMTPGTTIAIEKAVQLIKGGSSHEIHAERGNKIQSGKLVFMTGQSVTAKTTRRKSGIFT